jgi:hypothetical protein
LPTVSQLHVGTGVLGYPTNKTKQDPQQQQQSDRLPYVVIASGNGV